QRHRSVFSSIALSNSADQRLLLGTLADRHQRPLRGTRIELPRAEDAGLRIGNHLVPVREPANSARHREEWGKHRRRQAQRTENDAGIEVDVGVELALDEVVVLEGDALQLHGERQKRIVALAQSVEHLIAALAQYLGTRVVALVDAVTK